jgi:hypothetical protein
MRHLKRLIKLEMPCKRFIVGLPAKALALIGTPILVSVFIEKRIEKESLFWTGVKIKTPRIHFKFEVLILFD